MEAVAFVHPCDFSYGRMSSSLESSRFGWTRQLNQPARPETGSLGAVNRQAEHSYRQILNSSVLIGGSSVVTTLAAIARNKVVAVFLGPAGVGLMGLYGSTTSVVVTLAGMGVTTSGVREIADATGAGDEIRVARTAAALRRVVLWLGILGSLLLAAFSIPVSRLTFGSTDHAREIVVLSLVILATCVSQGQLAQLQGFRRMGDLARVAVAGAVLTLVLTVPIVYVWRQDAVVGLVVAASGAALLSSWWYVRRVQRPLVSMTWRQTLHEARPLLRLGLAWMSSALMVAAIAYVVRVVIARSLGLGAAGIFQSATALSSVYCGFILSALGADFLPRLSAVADDDATCNRLVNEQVEVGLLLAFPGICATLAFAPLIIELLYSGRFGPAADVLRWQVLGVFLRVASWPMGYLLIAKGKATLYFWTEVSYNLLYAALTWIGVRLWGLPGAGVAFFGLYIYYCLLMCVVTRRLSGFTWSTANTRFASIAIPTVAFVFVFPLIVPAAWHVLATGAATVLAGLYSLRMLLALPGSRDIPRALSRRIPLFRGSEEKAADFLKVRHG
jgi:enterobacterial common antigen flippase